MNVSAPFIKRPIATSLIIAAIFLAGLAAYPFLPVAPLPSVEFPTLTVTANFPGASPQTMATAVATPLETQFGQIAGLAQMTSVNVSGSTQITMQFDLARSIDAALTDVLAAINAAGGQLPKDIPNPPTVRKTNPADAPILIMGVTSDVLSLTEVDNYAENILAQQLSQVTGVSQVLVGGQQTPAVRVQVDPGKLASLGLTLEDVRTVLSASTANAPKGLIDGPTQSYSIYANDQRTKASEYDDAIISYRGTGPVRVRDVGHAVDGPQNTKLAAWQNGKPAVLLLVFKQPGANVISTVDAVEAKLPRLVKSIPPDIKVEMVSDRTQTIRASVDDVEFTLLLSIGLVVAVIFVFLRSVWATIIPSVTIPVALVGTLGAMYVLGYSLDNLSLMGLTIAVGFVVDDAIVMLENIVRHIEEGMAPYEAALKGSGEIGFTIVSISVSLIAVFIPLLLMSGIVGRLFREFAIVVSITIVASAIVSLTLTPMMASRFLVSEHGRKHGRLYKMVEAMFDGMVGFYERTLDVALKFRLITLMVFFGVIVATGFLFTIIPKGFFPAQDTGIVIGVTDAAQDVSFAAMSDLQQKINKMILDDPAVAGLTSSVGAGAGGQTQNNGRMYIQLKPWSDRTDTASQVITRLRGKAQDIEGIRLFMQPAQDISVGGRLSRTQYQYTLSDPDGDELNAWGPKLLDKMRQLPQLADVTSDAAGTGLTLTLTYDKEEAARYGVQPATIDSTLYDAFGQRQVAQYFTGLKAYYVILEATPTQQGELDTLRKLYVKSASGALVPLSTIVHASTAPVQPLVVNHQSQFPSVTISYNLKEGVSLGDSVVAIERAQAELGVPATVTGAFQGTAQAFQSSLASQPYLIAAALIAVYIILGILYESYILPLTILSTLPAAGVGALLFLLGFGFDLTVIAIVGIILLIGIVKKNGIMMVDFAINAERNEGKSPEEAIREACLLRFRPILMTTMAALLSGLPLMLGTGAGSELRRPLGFAMVGGLALSQILTLYTTPVVYLYLDKLQQWLSPAKQRQPSRVAKAMTPAAQAAE
ncbi:MAG: efflux RND transporter permease subunit [Janthinobacterium lividum]